MSDASPSWPSPVNHPRAIISLALSGDTTVEEVLEDIPFFSVGILAFGIFTFFIIMKRINLLALYLYLSALLAFGSAILDLSQLLLRGHDDGERGFGDAAVTGLVNTREVGLSLSIGFRFLFLWMFISERPRGERPSMPREERKSSGFNPREDTHSASWRRWGYLGFTLQWTLLALSVSVPILQIIWRIAIRRYSIVYMVESTIEIAVSGLFILKLLLNVFLSDRIPWWRPLLPYIIPIIALSINGGVGIGNLILFEFSETTLGRFLQAVELYLLILYVLIAAFYRTDRPRAGRSRRSKGTSSFVGLSEKEGLSAFAQSTSENKGPADMDISGPISVAPTRPPRPDSVLSRMSSWILTRRTSRLSRNGDDIEQGSSGSREILTVARAAENLSPRVAENLSPRVQELINATAPLPSTGTEIQKEISSSGFADAPRARRSSTIGRATDPSPPADISSQPYDRTTGYSLGSYYQDNRLSALPSALPVPFSSSGDGSGSPVYGLNGIISGPLNRRQSAARPISGGSLVRRSANSLSSFDELLRQQMELDKSIAALRLFSPDPDVKSVPPQSLDSSVAPSSSRPSSRPPASLLPVPPFSVSNPASPRALNASLAAGALPSTQQKVPPLFTPPRQRTPSPAPLPFTTPPPEQPSVAAPTLEPPGDRTTSRASTSLQRINSTSTPSEFSLSNFPEPPTADVNRVTLSSPNLNLRPILIRSGTQLQNFRRDTVSFALPSSKIASDVPSLPTTPDDDGTRFHSAGTQYDVTSFIGDLTDPGVGRRFPSEMSEIQSRADSPTVAQEDSAPNLRPLVLGSTTITSPVQNPFADRSRPSDSSQQEELLPQPILKPLLLGNAKGTTPAGATPLVAPRSNVIPPTGPRKQQVRIGASSTTSRTRMVISNPRPPVSDGRGDQAPGAFERPRPAPLILQQSEK